MITVQEFAKALKISEVTAYRWIKAGKVTIIRLPGGDIRISEEEYERIISTKPNDVEGHLNKE